MLDIIYMSGTKIIFTTLNATVVPRVGDFIAAGNVKVVVKEVIWHMDNKTWVEVQI